MLVSARPANEMFLVANLPSRYIFRFSTSGTYPLCRHFNLPAKSIQLKLLLVVRNSVAEWRILRRVFKSERGAG
jgi:hypothetical protein